MGSRSCSFVSYLILATAPSVSFMKFSTGDANKTSPRKRKLSGSCNLLCVNKYKCTSVVAFEMGGGNDTVD